MNKLLISLFLSSAIVLSGQAQKKENYYVKHIEFPPYATLEQKVDLAARLAPTPQQYAWQQMELTAFLHFGINTFTGREWGDGKENPALFNPSGLDAGQWVRSLKDAGFKMVILTAKHHDGFCLWPTATTKHSVASSSWKNGRGDVVKELREACDKYGMKFGVYLSPWDRNAECYGDSPRYNEFFVQQLTELLTNYGEVHEVWFDGANGEGPNGKKQVYDWDIFYKTIQRLQPKAVMAIMGDDVRWVGNEKGLGRETEWSATVLAPGIYGRSDESNNRLGISSLSKDLGSRDMIEKATELFWYPSEVDVSIRPGWFYHTEEDSKVKSLKQLTDIYFQSVGYNSVLLLNIPPDRRGLIHEADVKRLMEFAAYRKNVFSDNRVKKGRKYWDAASGSEKIYALKPGSEINIVMIREDITKGQRVEAFTVEALTDNGWKEIGKGTTVGYKRLLRFPTIKAGQLRVRIDKCRLKANISQVAAYNAEPLQEGVQGEDWNTLPRSEWKMLSVSPLTIDLGQEVTLSAFTYAPLKAEAKPSMAFRYKFYVSIDGKKWQEVSANGEFSNIMNNPLPQTVSFGKKIPARFIRLESTTPTSTAAKVEMNEIGVTIIK
ncbi:alpha-L-fucosidase [Bacteroides sp.]|uniref:alpha-L-fucosidase n=1 Tax=Bacteroides sp. TaxID=29523 RepID=UPI0026379041|nr:alpha-L-fucosidase [Bacteroides sp.]MDD3038208.1 alpha-L-fucosidase [Bacteroides sp.]